LAVDEDGSGSDEGDQVGASPPLLGSVAQLVGHGRAAWRLPAPFVVLVRSLTVAEISPNLVDEVG